MRRSGLAAVGMVAMVLAVGCGGGGGGPGDAGSPDPGVTDSGTPDGSVTDPGFEGEPGPTDPGADPVEPDPGAQEVPPQDDPGGDKGALDIVLPDLTSPDQDPGSDGQPPSQFVIRVWAEGGGTGEPEPLPGVEVAILDNTTGQPLGPSGQTDENGEVAFDLEDGLVFAVSVRKETYIDRYLFDVREEWGSLDTDMLLLAMIEAVSQMIGVSWEPSKGIVTGRIVFQSEQGVEDVGCAVVESDKGGEVRYWDPAEDMPATPDKAPMTSQKNANFLVANVPPGPVALTAKVGDVTVATKQTLSFAGGMTSVDLAVTTATNPTPADCAY